MTKLYLYINNPEAFLRGELGLCLQASTYDPEYVASIWDWIPAGVIDVEIDVDENTVRQIAIDRLNNEIGQERAKAQVAVERIETRKQNLLAIEHQE